MAVKDDGTGRAADDTIAVQPPRKESCKPHQPSFCLWKLTISDVSSIISLASKRQVQVSDLQSCPHLAEEVAERFSALWDKESLTSKRPKIRRAVLKLVRGKVLLGLACQVLSIFFQFCGPFLINQVLKLIMYKQAGLCELPVFPNLRGPFAPVFDLFSEEYLCKDNANYMLGAAIFVVLAGGAFFQNHGQLHFQEAALDVRGAFIGVVYQKVLRMSSLGISERGAGMINNVAVNDTENLLASAPVLSLVLFAPFQIIFSFILLATLVKGTFLAGLGVVVLIFIIAAKVMTKAFKFKKTQLTLADQRIKLTNELLGAARIVKSYGWEKAFQDEVMRIRHEETASLRSQGLYFSIIGVVIIVAPVYLAVVTFSYYAAIEEGGLTADVVFTALSVLNLMRFPLAFLPFGILECIKILISFGRLQKLLESAELPSGAGRANSNAIEAPQLAIEDAEFGYHYEKPSEKGKGKGKGKGCMGCLAKLCGGKGKGKGKGKDDGDGKIAPDSKEDKGDESQLVKQVSGGDKDKVKQVDESQLVDVSMKGPGESTRVVQVSRALTVKRFQPVDGGLTMVVGPVGSGKTTLLTAMLGELETIKGTPIDVRCPIGYSSQVPWIVNATVEQNIKFGNEDSGFGQEWYDTVLEKCCLLSDLDVLPAGDKTEIGERGVNLSGGQKARVALARAVYAKTKFCLFDDPLAAVDAHVGKQLFHGICGPQGLLADTTRVLVTHQVQYLSMADQIVLIDGGAIKASGTYAELSAQGLLSDLISGGEEEEKAQRQISTPTSPKLAKRDFAKDAGALTAAEESASGRVTFSVYSTTACKYWGSGLFCTWFTSLLLCSAIRACTDLWLAEWVAESDPLGFSTTDCSLMYAALGAVQAVLVFIRINTGSTYGWIRTSRKMYLDLFRSVFASPTVFFDITPAGRILNRFTADMDILDSQLPRMWTQTMACFETVLTVLFAIVYSEPMVALIMIPTGICYGLLANYYRHIARDVQRLESVTKTPIFSRLSEVLGGLSCARAFGFQNVLLTTTFHDINNNQAANWIKIKTGCWLSLRLEVMSCIISTGCVIIPTLSSKVTASNPALVGVALTYGLELSRFIQALTKFGADLEQKFTSVERILEYCALPSEAASTLPADESLGKWPVVGSIEYKDVTMRYRATLDPVLKGLSFSVKGGEKLGIVGRTGSGKSSIIVTLLRLTECEGGTILIDGTNTREMGLLKLRHCLSMIPQDPIMFGNTTLRKNLDPFDQFSDEAVQTALVKVRMDKQDAIKDGLSTMITEGGACFSVGERQLLCLARAMLRSSKITLLDEATASVDNETDDLIQLNIRETFKESTVICIAHRIKTILDSDKILVMSAGICEEFGTPGDLLNRKDSYFRESCQKSGIEVPELDHEKQMVSV
jgi:ABC-type multidrug transport system fused ATPase/permease subunit